MQTATENPLRRQRHQARVTARNAIIRSAALKSLHAEDGFGSPCNRIQRIFVDQLCPPDDHLAVTMTVRQWRELLLILAVS